MIFKLCLQHTQLNEWMDRWTEGISNSTSFLCKEGTKQCKVVCTAPLHVEEYPSSSLWPKPAQSLLSGRILEEDSSEVEQIRCLNKVWLHSAASQEEVWWRSAPVPSGEHSGRKGGWESVWARMIIIYLTFCHRSRKVLNFCLWNVSPAETVRESFSVSTQRNSGHIFKYRTDLEKTTSKQTFKIITAEFELDSFALDLKQSMW